MKYSLFKYVGISALTWLGLTAKAQPSQEGTAGADYIATDTISQKGYTLIVVNKEKEFSQQVLKQMIQTFFTVYPQEASLYNRKTLKQVTFVVDPAYDGVAGCSDGIITFSPAWLKQHPADIDVVTHETMHIVQNYPGDAGPGWLTEGIADYVRYKLGVNNGAAGWALPAFSADQHYEQAYRVTARFLVWIEKHVKAGIVKKLDSAMRSKTYTASIWKELTGKTVEELWQAYSSNSTL